MTKFQIEGKLTEMMGKQWMYAGKAHTFLRFKCEENLFTVITDKSDLVISNENGKDFFTDCLIIDQEDAYVPQKNVVVTHVELPQTTIRSNSSILSETILDSIKKIKEDKDYIAQANAINDQLKSMIELGKTEIETMKLQVQLHKMNGL